MNSRARKIVCRLLLLTVAVNFVPRTLAAGAPVIVPHDNFQNVVRLPNGQLWRLASRFNAIYRSISTDNGNTWQGGFDAGSKLFDVFGGLNPQPIVAPDGSLHLFVAKRPEAGPIEFDVWHYQSNPQRTSWSAGAMIHDGNTGSIVKVLGTRAGGMIVPFGDKNVPPPAGFGAGQTVIRYRNAGASTFSLSSSVLRSPVPTGWNGASDGACEPTLIEKNDGSLWMLMRSQTGKLTESTSTNQGATWTPAVDSKFYTTTGPPCLVPMDNGDMVMLWNNATMPPRHNNQVWYAGRDVLHGAISRDQGQTWSGFREIYLDPFRNENPVAGDTGTAYPFATSTADGKIIAITGQATAKAQLRIDPAWLLETNRSDNFTAADPLANWSVFKPYGDVVSVKRNRVAGAAIIDDPDPMRAKNVLHIRKPDDKDPDGATWNFPMAERGVTKIRIKLQSGFQGGAIALTDRFFNPTDSQGEANAFFRLPISANGILPNGAGISMNQWHDLTLDWKTSSRTAFIRLDGVQVGTLSAQAGINVWPGLSYLRLRSTATTVDTAGFLIDSVAHIAAKLREAKAIPEPVVHQALSSASNWYSLPMSIDMPRARGESREVTTQIESTDESLTLRFVDRKNALNPAAVSQIAWRINETFASERLSIQLLDVNGEEIPDFSVLGSFGSFGGFESVEDGRRVPAIHAVRFTFDGDTPAINFLLSEFVYRGASTLIPEPATAVLLAALFVLCRRMHD